jgi:hypothetical protein
MRASVIARETTIDERVKLRPCTAQHRAPQKSFSVLRMMKNAIGAMLIGIARIPGIASKEKPRALMPRESELLHRMFGDAIDLSRVRVVVGAVGLPRGVGNVIYWPKRGFYGSQMSSGGIEREGEQTFVHEAAHVVQFQQRGAGYLASSVFAQIAGVIRGKTRDGAYQWQEKAALGVPWSKLGAEEQAHLVDEAFAARVDHGGRLVKDDIDFTMYARRALIEARACRGWA